MDNFRAKLKLKDYKFAIEFITGKGFYKQGVPDRATKNIFTVKDDSSELDVDSIVEQFNRILDDFVKGEDFKDSSPVIRVLFNGCMFGCMLPMNTDDKVVSIIKDNFSKFCKDPNNRHNHFLLRGLFNDSQEVKDTIRGRTDGSDCSIPIDLILNYDNIFDFIRRTRIHNAEKYFLDTYTGPVCICYHEIVVGSYTFIYCEGISSCNKWNYLQTFGVRDIPTQEDLRKSAIYFKSYDSKNEPSLWIFSQSCNDVYTIYDAKVIYNSIVSSERDNVEIFYKDSMNELISMDEFKEREMEIIDKILISSRQNKKDKSKVSSLDTMLSSIV